MELTGGGFVYRSQDELRQAVSALAHDDTVRAELGERARHGYESFYSEDRYIEGYLALIEQIKERKLEVVEA